MTVPFSLLPDRSPATLAALKQCAERYNVSLIAAALRWLSYTTRRAILVNSRDGDILWARSSESALRTGAYFQDGGSRPYRSACNVAGGQPWQARGGTGRNGSCGRRLAAGANLRNGIARRAV